MFTIIIDPGHGLPDPGAVGPTGLKEEAVVLEVAKKVSKLLSRDNRKVLLTRRDHNCAGDIPSKAMSLTAIKNKSLKAIVEMADMNHADLFVSIHANGDDDPKIHGFEVFHNQQGQAPANAVFESMKKNLQSHHPRRCELARFFVLRKNRRPAILVELEFITNPEQEKIFQRPESLEFYAKTIAQGIEAWLADIKTNKEKMNVD